MKTIFFDLDDTLYKAPIEECNEILIAYTAKKYAISLEVAKTAFETGKKQTKELLPDVAATHNRLLYVQHMLEYLKKNVITDTLELYNVFWDNFLEKSELRKGVKETLEELKSNGVSVGICTDLTAHIQHRKLQKLGLASYIDWLVTSEEAGEEKPSIKMFHLCAKKAKCGLSDIIYAGDNYKKDFLGASNAGMKAILYDEGKYPDFYKFYQEEIKQWI